jgi:hypothetical protein
MAENSVAVLPAVARPAPARSARATTLGPRPSVGGSVHPACVARLGVPFCDKPALVLREHPVVRRSDDPPAAGKNIAITRSAGLWMFQSRHLHMIGEVVPRGKSCGFFNASREESTDRADGAAAGARRTDTNAAEKQLERVKGIEPSYSAWKAAALPLSYTRIGVDLAQSGAPCQAGWAPKSAHARWWGK